MTVALPGAQRAAAQVHERLAADERAISIVGRDGSGKSSTLALVGARLAEEGALVLPVELPKHGDFVMVSVPRAGPPSLHFGRGSVELTI